MAFWKSKGKNIRALDNFGLATTQTIGNGGTNEEFYEMELGVVLDIVLDDTHPIFSQREKFYTAIDTEHWPEDLENKKPLETDKDLSWVGRALIRPLTSQPSTDKYKLPWAYPLEGNLSEFPLVNETVVLVNYRNKLFYTRKVNLKNWPHNSLDFGIEQTTSGRPNQELYKTEVTPYKGPESITKFRGGLYYTGVAGRYYVANNKIRSVRRFEGDLLIESRFGQTIHFTAYDTNRNHDVGDSKYSDYKNGGNPMILIRNRQRPLVKEGQKLVPHKKLPPIIGTAQEKNVGGFLDENIHHDGSSIHITSGQTISQWVTSCYKKLNGCGEETSAWNGTPYVIPTLDGDQIVIQSDRLVFSARYGETYHYSKKRYGIVTDADYIVDAHQQIVITSNTKTVINSPAIYLGEYDMTNEPALLGQTTVNWLYELCNWLLEHTHWYIHSHVDAGKESPSKTQKPVQVKQLEALRDKLKNLMSRRVFITGGGLAPGQNGSSIIDGTDPIKINIGSGEGVPGGWKGKNYRPTP